MGEYVKNNRPKSKDIRAISNNLAVLDEFGNFPHKCFAISTKQAWFYLSSAQTKLWWGVCQLLNHLQYFLR